MTDEQQKLSDRFWQAYLFLQACAATADDKDESLFGKEKLKETCEALLSIYKEWRTYIKDPISLDPFDFAAELHRLADKIERGELVL